MELSGQWSDMRAEPAPVDAGRMLRNRRSVAERPTSRKDLPKAETRIHARRDLNLQILLSEVLQADRQLKRSLRTLAHAVQTSQAEGLALTFFEEEPTILDLLREIRSSRSGQDNGDAADLFLDIDRWIRELGMDRPAHIESLPATAPQPLNGALTCKEVQVLDLLAHGYSNEGMAQHLFISESTVRTHLRSINLKLRAGSRTQAIAIARKLHLIA